MSNVKNKLRAEKIFRTFKNVNNCSLMIFFEHYFVISKIFYFYIKNQFVLFVENRLHLFEKILFFFYFFYKFCVLSLTETSTLFLFFL